MADEKRPSRSKMCNWLAHAIGGVQVRPNNPANIQLLATLAKEADRKLRLLAEIAGEMGWHADASLDTAWELIQEYDAERKQESESRT